MILIRKCKSAVKLFNREMQWRKDRRFWRKSIQPKEVQQNLEGTILILMPHSDDEWIGCSTILRKNENVHVLNMDMGGGDTPELHRLRLEEAQNAANRFGYSLYMSGENKLKGLVKLLEQYMPDYVLLPCYLDWHEEHLEVMEIFLDSIQKSTLKKEPQVVMYQISLPMPYYLINCCYPMTKQEWHIKWRELCNLYRSQNFLPIRRFAYNERINGAVCGTYACEVFSIKTFDVWKQEFQKYKFTRDEKFFCQEHIQEIGTIREWLEERGRNTYDIREK